MTTLNKKFTKFTWLLMIRATWISYKTETKDSIHPRLRVCLKCQYSIQTNWTSDKFEYCLCFPKNRSNLSHSCHPIHALFKLSSVLIVFAIYTHVRFVIRCNYASGSPHFQYLIHVPVISSRQSSNSYLHRLDTFDCRPKHGRWDREWEGK